MIGVLKSLQQHLERGGGINKDSVGDVREEGEASRRG